MRRLKQLDSVYQLQQQTNIKANEGKQSLSATELHMPGGENDVMFYIFAHQLFFWGDVRTCVRSVRLAYKLCLLFLIFKGNFVSSAPQLRCQFKRTVWFIPTKHVK